MSAGLFIALRLPGICALLAVLSCGSAQSLSADADPAVTTVATPPPFTPHCATSRGAPRIPALSQTQIDNMRRMAASSLGLVFQPDGEPNRFFVHFSQGWNGDELPAVRLDPGSVDVTLLTHDGHTVARAQSLGQVPLPHSLYNPCYDDHGVTYRYVLPEAKEPGLYTVSISARALPMTLSNGETIVPHSAATIDVYMPGITPVGPRPGTAYLVVPQPGVTYIDDTGKVIAWNEIAMHVARIGHIDGDIVTLTIDGTNYRLLEKRPQHSVMLAGLLELEQDAASQAMNRWYAGKHIWTRGGLSTACSLQPNTWNGFGGGSSPAEVRVVHVYRVVAPLIELGIGPQMESIGGVRESSFRTSAPLLVALDVAGAPSAYGGYSNGLAAPPNSASWGCGTSYTYFADAWDLQRAFSTVSVREAHPDWPAEKLNAIESHRLEKGMTREMVAWTIGFPATYAPVDDLYRMVDWRYDDLRPFNFWVHFDAHGLVKSFGADGHLP